MTFDTRTGKEVLVWGADRHVIELPYEVFLHLVDEGSLDLPKHYSNCILRISNIPGGRDGLEARFVGDMIRHQFEGRRLNSITRELVNRKDRK